MHFFIFLAALFPSFFADIRFKYNSYFPESYLPESMFTYILNSYPFDPKLDQLIYTFTRKNISADVRYLKQQNRCFKYPSYFMNMCDEDDNDPSLPAVQVEDMIIGRDPIIIAEMLDRIHLTDTLLPNITEYRYRMIDETREIVDYIALHYQEVFDFILSEYHNNDSIEATMSLTNYTTEEEMFIKSHGFKWPLYTTNISERIASMWDFNGTILDHTGRWFHEDRNYWELPRLNGPIFTDYLIYPYMERLRIIETMFDPNGTVVRNIVPIVEKDKIPREVNETAFLMFINDTFLPTVIYEARRNFHKLKIDIDMVNFTETFELVELCNMEQEFNASFDAYVSNLNESDFSQNISFFEETWMVNETFEFFRANLTVYCNETEEERDKSVESTIGHWFRMMGKLRIHDAWQQYEEYLLSYVLLFDDETPNSRNRKDLHDQLNLMVGTNFSVVNLVKVLKDEYFLRDKNADELIRQILLDFEIRRNQSILAEQERQLNEYFARIKKKLLMYADFTEKMTNDTNGTMASYLEDSNLNVTYVENGTFYDCLNITFYYMNSTFIDFNSTFDDNSTLLDDNSTLSAVNLLDDNSTDPNSTVAVIFRIAVNDVEFKLNESEIEFLIERFNHSLNETEFECSYIYAYFLDKKLDMNLNDTLNSTLNATEEILEELDEDDVNRKVIQLNGTTFVVNYDDYPNITLCTNETFDFGFRYYNELYNETFLWNETYPFNLTYYFNETFGYNETNRTWTCVNICEDLVQNNGTVNATENATCVNLEDLFYDQEVYYTVRNDIRGLKITYLVEKYDAARLLLTENRESINDYTERNAARKKELLDYFGIGNETFVVDWIKETRIIHENKTEEVMRFRQGILDENSNVTEILAHLNITNFTTAEYDFGKVSIAVWNETYVLFNETHYENVTSVDNVSVDWLYGISKKDAQHNSTLMQYVYNLFGYPT